MPYHVYAIKLDRHSFAPPKAFRAQNPHIEWERLLPEGLRYYYVGQSAHEPDCRFAQHKQCHGPQIKFQCLCKGGLGKRRAARKLITKNRSNKYVREYGLYLARKEFAHFRPMKSRDEALEIEAVLAQSLRRKGHAVYFN